MTGTGVSMQILLSESKMKCEGRYTEINHRIRLKKVHLISKLCKLADETDEIGIPVICLLAFKSVIYCIVKL